MSAAEQLGSEVTFTRFTNLYDTKAVTETMSWPALVAVLSKCEPFQGDSDHPGWSPAEFDPPKRELANVQRVSTLALDYDNKAAGNRVADPFTVEQAAEAFAGYKCLIYTTRNHTTDWPRFRVVLPLARPVTAAEYTKLWHAADTRWPGGDKQPKDPSRFWYMPGVIDQPGAEFVPVELHGEPLDPDTMLCAPKALLALSSPPAAHSDPLLVARARAYIERMPPAISGQGGHPATWNVARKLVADFGLGEETAMVIMREYNLRCVPQWSEDQLRHKVRDAFTKAKVSNPIQDRDVVTQPGGSGPLYQGAPPGTVAAPAAGDWRANLRINQNNQMTKDVGNVALLLNNEPGFRGSLMFDSMAYRIFWYLQPSYKVGIKPPDAGEDVRDHHATYVAQVLAKNHGLTVGKDLVWAGIESAAQENKIHPVQDYIDRCEWDGIPRLPKVLHTYFGCDDTPYNAAVGRWFLISAVARAYRPGCQADHVLILEGQQGYYKSQAIKALGDPWVLGSLPDIRAGDGTKAIEAIGGHWLVEIAEMNAFKGAAMTKIKDFVTLQTDVYRPPYARVTLKRPRSCVFIGTTNESTYLNDPTGARRFWPVKVVNKIDTNKIEADRDQLWAEAKAMLDMGEKWYPTDPAMLETIAEEQDARREQHPWEAAIALYVAGCGDSEITTEGILHSLQKPVGTWGLSDRVAVSTCMRVLGYEPDRRRVEGADGKKHQLPRGHWKKIDS